MSTIAIQTADLDDKRIDGTRVYIFELLKRFGNLSKDDRFYLYHRSEWNKELTPLKLPNYSEHVLKFPFYWTQTRFLAEMWRTQPDVLWMPMQALPVVLPRSVRTVVTMHDLAFKIFPEMFTRKDLQRLNLFADFAVKKADKLIAVSEATKKDIIKFYPDVCADKIHVIHHGFNAQISKNDEDEKEVDTTVLEKFSITGDYIFYVGALQPRKNLVRLVKAFNIYVKERDDLQLVLAGGKGWMWEEIVDTIEKSQYRDRIILTGKVSFEDMFALYRKARVFAFVSLYEGFGLPLLEAFAAGVPVVTANNSSLPEVAGDAALLADATDVDSIYENIKKACEDESLRKNLIARGKKRLTHFSWDRCAEETLKVLLK